MPIADDDIDASPSPALRWLQEHGDALYAYALARVRNSTIAEDLVQEALLAALAGTDEFLRQSAERTWLIGILRHKLLDHLRHKLRERPISEISDDGLSDLFDRRGRWKTPPAKWNGDPRELAERAEFRDVLARCMSRLPTRMAQLFWLREAEGVETGALCDQLDVTPANVWTLLHRARACLRRCLTIHWFEGKAR